MPKGVYPRTEEHRRINRDCHTTPEYKSAASGRHRGKRSDGKPVQGSFISPRGYRILTGQQGHPLADAAGGLPEHRRVLYEKIGPGEHNCHWCGRVVFWKSSVQSEKLCGDHLDDDKLNNDPENLVPSCFKCNWFRGDKTRKAYIEAQR